MQTVCVCLNRNVWWWAAGFCVFVCLVSFYFFEFSQVMSFEKSRWYKNRTKREEQQQSYVTLKKILKKYSSCFYCVFNISTNLYTHTCDWYETCIKMYAYNMPCSVCESGNNGLRMNNGDLYEGILCDQIGSLINHDYHDHRHHYFLGLNCCLFSSNKTTARSSTQTHTNFNFTNYYFHLN